MVVYAFFIFLVFGGGGGGGFLSDLSSSTNRLLRRTGRNTSSSTSTTSTHSSSLVFVRGSPIIDDRGRTSSPGSQNVDNTDNDSYFDFEVDAGGASGSSDIIVEEVDDVNVKSFVNMMDKVR